MSKIDAKPYFTQINDIIDNSPDELVLMYRIHEYIKNLETDQDELRIRFNAAIILYAVSEMRKKLIRLNS